MKRVLAFALCAALAGTVWADTAPAAGPARSAAQPAAVAAAAAAPVAPDTPAAPALFQKHCAACHGADRLGGSGPALLPENLERLRRPEAERVIREGRVATQMAGFGVRPLGLPGGELAPHLGPNSGASSASVSAAGEGRSTAAVGPDASGDRPAPPVAPPAPLDEAAIKALAAWIYTPVTPAPVWGEPAIRASRLVHHGPGSLPDRPVFTADPLNLFIVVEAGDHHVSILDGDKLEAIARVPTRYALHGGPKFSPDGRYVYFGSRDGWVSKFDLWNLKTVAEVRAGINTRNVAVSSDGKWVLVGNYLPQSVVLLDAELNFVKTIPARDLEGKRGSRVSAVYDAAPRKSFVVALKDVPELWEISYDEKAAPIYDGYVHDYKMGEGIAKPGFLNPRRTPLTDVLDDFFFDDSYAHVFGATRPDGKGQGKGQVVNLDVRRKIADLDLPGMPHLGSGIAFDWHGRRVMATPNLKDGVISVIDTQTWKTVASVVTPGPGFFLRSHEKARYAFADSMMSREAKDTLVAIDKATLTVAARLRPEPGKTFAHVEFTRDGRYALASLMEPDGALIVLDAATLTEVKRLPMRKPIGKYNVWNKISRSEGTSH